MSFVNFADFVDEAERGTITNPLNAAYDYVIVGAGSAGCVVARRLLDQSDARVLLIEAGGPGDSIEVLRAPHRWVENIGAAHDWGYRYSPTASVLDRAVPLSRGKVAGGSGRTNALVWARGARADFDDWGENGNLGWDYDSVLPFFRKSEDWEGGASRLRGAGGPIHVERARELHPVASALIDAGRSYGMPYLDDINIERPEGVGPINTNVRDGVRCSSWEGYIEPVLGHPRLTVVTGAQVTRLLFEGYACRGVEVLWNGALHHARATQEVVLSAGAIDTPRLLMLSGVGDADALRSVGVAPRHHLPGVGQNLQEHVIIAGLCFEARRPLLPFNNNLEGSTFFWRSHERLDRADLMFVAVQIPYVTPELGSAYRIPENAFCIAPGLMRVRSRGHVRLLGARHDCPLEIRANMLAEEADIETLLEGMELGLDIADQPAYRELIKNWVAPAGRRSKAERRDFLRRAATAYFHPVGTCAMGRDAESVADSELRVKGLERLRIVDASVMPSITSANTNAPTVMIAERASNLILSSLQG